MLQVRRQHAPDCAGPCYIRRLRSDSRTGAGEILLSLDVFEDCADAELFAFASKAERFGRGLEGLPCGAKLIEKRIHSSVTLDNLAGDCVSSFAPDSLAVSRRAWAARERPSRIIRPADAPAKGKGVIFG